MISKPITIYKIIITGLTVFILTAACNSVPGKITDTITRSVNKSELEKVIKHYRQAGDNRKLKALYFLLENIDYHQHMEGTGIDNYNKIFGELAKTPESRKECLEVIFDSLTAANNGNNWGAFTTIRDFNSIHASHLISHIDAAFAAWERPWAKHLSFEEFKEYILPYKVLEENPDQWMVAIQHSYNDVNFDTDNPYKACLLINDLIKRRFTIRTLPSFSDLNFGQLEKIRSGKCGHAAQYTAYVMRSFGVPVAIDYSPWGNMNGEHTWNALIYKGKPIPFVGSESNPGKTKIDQALNRKRSKIYRHSYSIQKQELQFLTQNTEEIPDRFKSYYIRDVTKQYIPVSDIQVQLDTSHTMSYAYLCVFNSRTWIPVYWGKCTHNTVLFKDMGRGIVYLPAKYENNELKAVAAPVILHQNGDTEILHIKPDQRRQVTLKKKSPYGPNIVKGNEYSLYYWDSAWKLLESKMATANSIVFEQVPDNALLWVRSKDKPVNERPFIFKNGEQVWY
jgi:hypothetical protein